MSDKPKILIIDDELRMRQSVKELLASQNYELDTANSAKEAIEFLNNNNVDLILLDLCLPDKNGYHVMDHIGQPSLGALVIILTGHGSEESAIEALRRGAYDYLKKPFEPEKLLITVKNALNQKKIKMDKEHSNIYSLTAIFVGIPFLLSFFLLILAAIEMFPFFKHDFLNLLNKFY